MPICYNILFFFFFWLVSLWYSSYYWSGSVYRIVVPRAFFFVCFLHFKNRLDVVQHKYQWFRYVRFYKCLCHKLQELSQQPVASWYECWNMALFKVYYVGILIVSWFHWLNIRTETHIAVEQINFFCVSHQDASCTSRPLGDAQQQYGYCIDLFQLALRKGSSKLLPA